MHFNLAVLKGFLLVSHILSWSAEAKSYKDYCSTIDISFQLLSYCFNAAGSDERNSGRPVMMRFVTALMDLMYPDCIPMADDSPTFTIPVAKI